MRATILCLLLATCSLAPPDAGTPSSKAAIADAYLIAHGMAVSYSRRPGADPSVTAELIRLDRRAHTALLSDFSGGSGLFRPTSDWGASARAVAALSDFASRLTERSP